MHVLGTPPAFILSQDQTLIKIIVCLKLILSLEIASLRREKDDVTEVREGYECGITLGYKDITEGDVIETWEMREKARD